ncbi:unnamed protein product [Umbelopsis vinacea]
MSEASRLTVRSIKLSKLKKDYTVDKDAQAITIHKALSNGPLQNPQEIRSHTPDNDTWPLSNKDPSRYTLDDDSQFVPAHERPKLPTSGSAYSEYPFYQETASESSYASSSDSSSFTKSQSIQSPTFPPSFHIVEYTAEIVTIKASDLSFFAPPQPNQTSSCPPTPPLNSYNTSLSPPLSAYRPTSGYAKSWMDGIRTSLENIRPSSPNPSPNEHKLTVFSINGGKPEQRESEWL